MWLQREIRGNEPATWRRVPGLMLAMVLMMGVAPRAAHGQQVLTEPERVITIARGGSALLTRPTNLERVSIADPEVADAVVISAREVLITANAVGTTSLLVWAENDVVRLFNVEVAADVASLARQLDALFPDVGLEVTTAGNTLILSGQVRDPSVVRRAMELATTTGAAVINNIQAPSPEQVLLHVEFAEVRRSAIKELGGELVRVLNPARVDEAFDKDDTHIIETLSEGFVTLTVMGDNTGLEAIIGALKGRGEFRSLAEPNLIALEGQEATFLAGGEFPFPVIQGGQSNAVTITWKEFGVRLNFTPTVTNAGNVRLHVTPEVSSLDFANGLTISGFEIPSLLTRRVETDVELAPAQTLAIGGLMDNRLLDQVDKIPILGDLPILGFFFRSQSARQDRTELLVLVTPYIVDPSDPPPDLPTGPWETWDWDGPMRPEATRVRPSGN